MTTETLSDKIICLHKEEEIIVEDDYVIPKEDVREFIKQLKARILNDCSNYKLVDNANNLPELLDDVSKTIDELAGKELCE